MKIEHFTGDETESISWQRTWDEAGEGDEWPSGAERLTEILGKSQLVGMDIHQVLNSGLSLDQAEDLSCQQVEREQRGGEGEDEKKNVEELVHGDESEHPSEMGKHHLPQISNSNSSDEFDVEKSPGIGYQWDSQDKKVDDSGDEVSLVEMSHANTSERAVMVTAKNAYVTNGTMMSSGWRHRVTTMAMLETRFHDVGKCRVLAIRSHFDHEEPI